MLEINTFKKQKHAWKKIKVGNMLWVHKIGSVYSAFTFVIFDTELTRSGFVHAMALENIERSD